MAKLNEQAKGLILWGGLGVGSFALYKTGKFVVKHSWRSCEGLMDAIDDSGLSVDDVTDMVNAYGRNTEDNIFPDNVVNLFKDIG